VRLPSAPPLLTDMPCPKCKAPLNLRRSKRGPWLSCSKFPKCRGRLGWNTLPEEQQKQLELKLLNHEKENPVPTLRKTDGSAVPDYYKPQAGQPTGDSEPASPEATPTE
jgi:DNA topoisomerase-1